MCNYCMPLTSFCLITNPREPQALVQSSTGLIVVQMYSLVIYKTASFIKVFFNGQQICSVLSPCLQQDILQAIERDASQANIEAYCSFSDSYGVGKGIGMHARLASISRAFGTSHYQALDGKIRHCLEKWLRIDGKIFSQYKTISSFKCCPEKISFLKVIIVLFSCFYVTCCLPSLRCFNDFNCQSYLKTSLLLVSGSIQRKQYCKISLSLVSLDTLPERNRFHYDTVWGGLFLRGEDGEAHFYTDFGFPFYNDHHFHLGYFLYALAYYVRHDTAWAQRMQNNLI